MSFRRRGLVVIVFCYVFEMKKAKKLLISIFTNNSVQLVDLKVQPLFGVTFTLSVLSASDALFSSHILSPSSSVLKDLQRYSSMQAASHSLEDFLFKVAMTDPCNTASCFWQLKFAYCKHDVLRIIPFVVCFVRCIKRLKRKLKLLVVVNKN